MHYFLVSIVILVEIQSQYEILEVRLIAACVEFGDQFEEISAVLSEDVVLLLYHFPFLRQVPGHPCRNYPREFGDGAEDVPDNFHNRSSFGVEKTSEECPVQIFVMDGDQIVKTGNVVQIFLELQP